MRGKCINCLSRLWDTPELLPLVLLLPLSRLIAVLPLLLLLLRLTLLLLTLVRRLVWRFPLPLEFLDPVLEEDFLGIAGLAQHNI